VQTPLNTTQEIEGEVISITDQHYQKIKRDLLTGKALEAITWAKPQKITRIDRDIRLHDLGHTAGSLMHEIGVNANEILVDERIQNPIVSHYFNEFTGVCIVFFRIAPFSSVSACVPRVMI